MKAQHIEGGACDFCSDENVLFVVHGDVEIVHCKSRGCVDQCRECQDDFYWRNINGQIDALRDK